MKDYLYDNKKEIPEELQNLLNTNTCKEIAEQVKQNNLDQQIVLKYDQLIKSQFPVDFKQRPKRLHEINTFTLSSALIKQMDQ